MAAMIALPTSTTLFSRHARQTNSKPKIHPMSYVKIILKFAGGGQKVPARHSKQQQNGASLLTASRAHTSTKPHYHQQHQTIKTRHKHRYNCQSKNIQCLITCQKCHKQYVRKAAKLLRLRLEQRPASKEMFPG